VLRVKQLGEPSNPIDH